jgi:parallel beta-helix repeat protein
MVFPWLGMPEAKSRGNTCKNTGYGISIAERAAPLVIDNQISENRSWDIRFW